MNARRKQIFNLLIGAALVVNAGKAGAQSPEKTTDHGPQTTSSQKTIINMKEAIDLALANNYSLRADSLNMLITSFKNKETAGFFLPQANMSSNMSYAPAIASQMLPGSVVGQPSKELVPVKFGTAYGMGTGIEVTQTIYRKDLSIRNKAAGLNNEIASTRYKLTKEELVYNVAYAYYSLQSQAESIRTTTIDYLSMKDILTIAKAQFEHGTLKRIDYESLRINVANKESQLTQLITQYNEQLDFFKYLLGLPVSTPLSINDSITSLSTHLSREANVLNREDLRLSYQMIQSKEVEMKSIRAEKLPSLNSFFKYNYQSQFNEAGKAFDNNYWYKSSSIGVSMSLPIFDGNRRKSRLNVAQTQLQQLKWQTIQQEQQVQTQIKTSWDKLDNNRQQLKTNQQNLELAIKVFESRKALYTEGVTTLVELLDAQRELTQARDLYMQSLINVQSGILEVHKANGTLITEFFKSI